MFRMIVKAHFDAAHALPNYDGKCARLHGHRWDVDIVLSFADDELGDDGLLIDFAVVKSKVKAILPDHIYLGGYPITVRGKEIEPLFENPTAEVLAMQVYKWACEELGPWLHHVTVWESPECGVTYYGHQQRAC